MHFFFNAVLLGKFLCTTHPLSLDVATWPVSPSTVFVSVKQVYSHLIESIYLLEVSTWAQVAQEQKNKIMHFSVPLLTLIGHYVNIDVFQTEYVSFIFKGQNS